MLPRRRWLHWQFCWKFWFKHWELRFLAHIVRVFHYFDGHPLHYLYSKGVPRIHFQILTGADAPVAPVLNAALNCVRIQLIVITMVYISQYFFQGNAYGYAYGSSRRSQGGYYRGREEAQAEDTRLKNLIRDTRETMNNTRQFWTKLPYDLCR